METQVKVCPYFRTREVYWALWWWMWLPISGRWIPRSALNSGARQRLVCRAVVCWTFRSIPRFPFSKLNSRLRSTVSLCSPPTDGKMRNIRLLRRNKFNQKAWLFNYLLFGVGQERCLLNRGGNLTNPRQTSQEQGSEQLIRNRFWSRPPRLHP